MSWLLNLLYAAVLVVALPWLLWRRWRTGRYRHSLGAKLLGRVNAMPDETRPTVWFHGVSVGEIHLLTTVVAAFRKRRPDVRIVVSSTTDTGLAEAVKKIPEAIVVPWPFDFSWAVSTALDRVRPALLVLAEGELWPNMLRIAHGRGVKIAVVNARLSPKSAARYARMAWLARPLLFRHIDRIAVQSESYHERFLALGLPAKQLCVTGSVKYDGAVKPILDDAFLRRIPKSDDVIWVVGSTHAPEEAITIQTFQILKPRFPQLKLILVPRHPDRFGEVGRLLTDSGIAFASRSKLTTPPECFPDVLLLDTIGELSAAWSIADVGYVGGSLDGVRGGQSMIEPAGCGVPTVFGPHVWNFRDAAEQLVACEGSIMIRNADQLTPAIERLLNDAFLRKRMSIAASEFVYRQRGATERTLNLLDDLLPVRPEVTRHAA